MRGLREALVTLPTQLNETYDEAMARIQGQVPEHRDLALSALKWILYAYRPLRQQELQGALAIRLGDTDFDTEAVQDIDLIVSVYGVSELLSIYGPFQETRRGKEKYLNLIHFDAPSHTQESNANSAPYSGVDHSGCRKRDSTFGTLHRSAVLYADYCKVLPECEASASS